MEGHTHSDKYSNKKPKPINLNEEIQRYEAIRNEIRKTKRMKPTYTKTLTNNSTQPKLNFDI